MELSPNELFVIIGRQQVEITMLRQQNAALRAQVQEPPKSGAAPSAEESAEGTKEA